MQTQGLGRHVLAEVYGCDFEILNDLEKIREIFVSAALSAGAEVRETAFHRFSPQGVSGVVVISESHLAIHTWPELGYAAVDVFTCGDRVDPWAAVNAITRDFGADSVKATEHKRGSFPKAVSCAG
jgi:S-adenosylmethionine decarboxylase